MSKCRFQHHLDFPNLPRCDISVLVTGCNLYRRKYVTQVTRGTDKSAFLLEQYLLRFSVSNLNIRYL